MTRLLTAAVLLTAGAVAQTASNPQLEKILTQMDEGSRQFQSATADFDADIFNSAVDDHDKQSGKIYFKRGGKGVQMAMQLEKPTARQVVYSNSQVQIYDPKINQLTQKSVGNNRAEVESFLVLGFGGPGHDLLKSYDITLDGNETINGTPTARLVLVPKAEGVRKNYNKIIVWIDPQRDVSLKQQAFQPSGDYRLVTYSSVKLNGQAKVPDSVFRIKTDKNTSVVK
jgi:outer membrane lipoprotein-sorting protein